MTAVPHTIQLYRTPKRRRPSFKTTSTTMTPAELMTIGAVPQEVQPHLASNDRHIILQGNHQQGHPDLVLGPPAGPTAHHQRNPRSSPSSVISMVEPTESPGRIQQSKHSCASTVRLIMNDNGGAELVAEFDSLSISQPSLPRTPRKIVRSLLDDEQSITPTLPSPKLEPKTPTSTNTEVALCCPTYSFDCLRKYDNGILEMIEMEKKIHALLGEKKHFESFFRDWQAWSYFGGINAVPKGTKIDQVKDVKNAFRNSITLGLERHQKLDSVRKDLNAFTTPSRQQLSPIKLAGVKSFDISRNSSLKSRGKQDDKQHCESNLSGLVSMLERGCLCNINGNTNQADSPALIRSGMLNAVREETCYDSDPEDERRSRKFISKNSPARSPARSPSNKENRTMPRSPHSGAGDDFVIKQMVEEFMNERLTLIHHSRDQAPKSSTPHAVKLWFERGSILVSGNVIQPRLMWTKVQRPNKKSKSNVPMLTTKAHGFDLVDVARVLAVDSVDRVHYPFAKPSSCFLVKTLDKSILFEAKSASERERIVRLLKLVVARLGSKLIVGDQSFFSEFFNSMHDGPGEAPEFF